MELNREILDRFVDGELQPKQMERVAAMLETHPEWDAYVRRQEQLRASLRARFRELDGQVPQRLIDAARTAPISWQWRLREWRKRNLALRRLAPAGAALALGLVIGVAVGPRGDIGANAAGQWVARGALAHSLDTELASAGNSAIGISFRDKSGRDCRTFAKGENAGLACRQAGAWVMETLVRRAPEDGGASYRMAGSAMPEAVRQAVMARIDGAPFDAKAEARARDAGWPGR